MGKKQADQAKKEAKKQRQQQKQDKASKKRASKEAREAGEADIETILGDLLKKEATKTAVTLTTCDGPPSPRANFSLTPLPTGEIALFGGEYYDGQDTTCYNELYRWNPERGVWRRVEGPNSPPPRCSHQAVCFRDFLYVFGGEFATSEQFYHYKDLWRLDLRSNLWEAVETRGVAPSARSGHRMVLYRNCLVLFGGFYEAFREVNWFNDLYILNLQDHRWQAIEFPPTTPIPGPRSGHQMAVHTATDQVFVYGGFVKLKRPGEKSEGKVLNDMWILSLKDLARPRWDRVGKRGTPPTPRSGASMCVHKGRALVFGGVYDVEGPHHSVQSVFYNDLYALDMERRQWFRLPLKRQRDDGVSAGGGGCSSSSRRRRRAGGAGADAAGAADGGDDASQVSAGTDAADEEDFLGSDEEGAVDGGPGAAAVDTVFVYVDERGKLVYVSLDGEDADDGTSASGSHAGPTVSATVSTVAAASAAAAAKAAAAAAAAAASADDATQPSSRLGTSRLGARSSAFETDDRAESKDPPANGGGWADVPQHGDASGDVSGRHSSAYGDSSGRHPSAHDDSGKRFPVLESKGDSGRSFPALEVKGAEGGGRKNEDLEAKGDTGGSCSSSGGGGGGGGDGAGGGIGGSSAAKGEARAAAAPLPRINPGLAVRGNTLLVYGGLVEARDREYTLDDCWSLDLGTRREWRRVLEGTMDQQIWRDDDGDSEFGSQGTGGADEEDESESGSESGSDSDGGSRGGSSRGVSSAAAAMSALSVHSGGGGGGAGGGLEAVQEEEQEAAAANGGSKKSGKKSSFRREGVREEIRELQARLGVDDPNRTPLVTESLRDFYARTVEYWTREFLAELERRGDTDRHSEKELRKGAFAMAGDRFAELEPVLQRLNELETAQKEAEADAVRGSGGGSGGGRRSHKGR